jgi:hypothetical protein
MTKVREDSTIEHLQRIYTSLFFFSLSNTNTARQSSIKMPTLSDTTHTNPLEMPL